MNTLAHTKNMNQKERKKRRSNLQIKKQYTDEKSTQD